MVGKNNKYEMVGGRMTDIEPYQKRKTGTIILEVNDLTVI